MCYEKVVSGGKCVFCFPVKASCEAVRGSVRSFLYVNRAAAEQSCDPPVELTERHWPRKTKDTSR